MELLQLDPAALAQLRAQNARPFAQRFQELAEVLAEPIVDIRRARKATELATMLDSPDTAERRAPATLHVMRTCVRVA